jgi:hypothetical protein
VQAKINRKDSTKAVETKPVVEAKKVVPTPVVAAGKNKK